MGWQTLSPVWTSHTYWPLERNHLCSEAVTECPGSHFAILHMQALLEECPHDFVDCGQGIVVDIELVVRRKDLAVVQLGIEGWHMVEW
jgi:hypothetical protein